MTNEIPIATVAKRIFRFALAKTDSVQDAEDLSQEILVSLLRSSEKLPGVRNFDAWLQRICQYSWSNYFRKEKRHWRTVDGEVLDTMAGPSACVSFGILQVGVAIRNRRQRSLIHPAFDLVQPFVAIEAIIDA